MHQKFRKYKILKEGKKTEINNKLLELYFHKNNTNL